MIAAAVGKRGRIYETDIVQETLAANVPLLPMYPDREVVYPIAPKGAFATCPNPYALQL
jgi:hypothetical protein